MSDFSLGNFLTKFIGQSISNMRGNSTEAQAKPPQGGGVENFSKNFLQKPPAQSVVVNLTTINYIPLQNLRMNHLESLDKALYIKDLMNLPKDLNELLTSLQKNIAQLSKENLSNLQGTINLSQLSLLLQANGKEAVSKMIMVMSEASKQGVGDLSQLKETMKLINASVSVAGVENPNQTLKSLMLLYLPWLPLQEGVDFELEIGAGENTAGEAESSLTILISTKNYGNIKATLVLMNGNSVNILINCADNFPKGELLKRVTEGGKNYSAQTTLMFESVPAKQVENSSQKTYVNMSNVSEISPFLLLAAHSLIRNTIEIDNEASSLE